MQAVPKSEQPKMIALVGGVVLVFGFVAFQLLSGLGIINFSGGPPTPPPPSGSVVAGTTVDGSVDTGEKKSGAAEVRPDDRIWLTDPPESAPPNPFRQIAGRKIADRVQSIPTPSVRPTVRPKPLPGPIVPLPITGPVGGNPAPEVPTAVVVEKPKLGGIISGSSPVAIIKIQGKDWVAGVGDNGPEGWKLESIKGNVVTLVRGSERLTLRDAG
ncbi:MAG: hypothetical protein SFX74_01120 [Fimbriimonadaceae bacterium]|nr:hypothetical protein [Fimbriimonadaceae bacterium]